MTRPVTSQQTAHDVGRRALTVALMSWCLLGVASAAPVGASLGQLAVPADSPWLPWLGCWQLVEETAASTGQPGGMSRFADRIVVCLTPSAADSGGVEVTTIADGEPVLVETLPADGAQHPVEETACTGWRRSTWSGDRARLFARAELACDDQETRRVSGVGLMTSSTTWLDIQLVSSGDAGRSPCAATGGPASRRPSTPARYHYPPTSWTGRSPWPGWRAPPNSVSTTSSRPARRSTRRSSRRCWSRRERPSRSTAAP